MHLQEISGLLEGKGGHVPFASFEVASALLGGVEGGLDTLAQPALFDTVGAQPALISHSSRVTVAQPALQSRDKVALAVIRAGVAQHFSRAPTRGSPRSPESANSACI